MIDASSQDQIAARLLSLRETKQAPLDRSTVPDIGTLTSSVRIATLCMSGESPAAWKLGGTTASTRSTFKVEVPYFGPLKAHEVHQNNAQLYRTDFIAPVVEPEILICLSEDIPPGDVALTPESLFAKLAWVALGLELPDTCLGNAAEAGVNWLVADRCAAGALIVGEQLPVEQLSELENHGVELTFDDAVVSTAPAGSIIGGVLSAGVAALSEFASHGITLNKNQIIATGGLCPAVALPDKTTDVRACLGPNETGFRFVV